ncbi:hypothetical protein ACN08N_25560 (plasmid) [Photobacterium leiognathi subsp. mandapamensis]|uniref:hypothetical protein n=1 Tax=Photobacterium leiognathi TaxID=553611 RepID=UPI003AF3FD0F
MALLEKNMPEPWWEDVCGNDDSNLREYWSGCKEFCAEVNKYKLAKMANQSQYVDTSVDC